MITLDEIRDRVVREEEFATMPHIAMKVMEMAEDPDVSAGDLEKVIAYDQVLTAEILKLANSPLYSPRQPIVSLKHAISYLGMAIIRSLTIMIAIRSLYTTSKDKSHLWSDLWKHSAASAVVGRSIAMSLKKKILNAEDMFILGLLHDFGKVVLLRFYPKEYEMLVEKLIEEGRSYYEVEKDLLGVTHPEVGAMVLGLWGLPIEIVNAVGKHHEKPEDPSIACICLSNIFCATWGYSVVDPLAELDNFADALRVLELDEDRWKEMNKEIQEKLKECDIFIGV